MGRFVEKYSIDCRAPKASLAMTEGISIHTETTSSRLPPNDKAHGNIRHFNKRYLFFITTITGLLLSFSASLAHGGFEKRAGDTVVYVTQTPVSPLVGEPVTVNLVFQANDSLERWKNLDVHIKLVDTFYGDESKDKVIYQTVSKTDANGSLNFYHTFDKENYFELSELSHRLRSTSYNVGAIRTGEILKKIEVGALGLAEEINKEELSVLVDSVKLEQQESLKALLTYTRI
jgi:hypothetical protein